MGVFAALFAWQRRGGSRKLLERLKPLGDMSYTLYIPHWPIMIFIGSWLLAASPTGTLPTTFQWILPGIALCVLIAWLPHFIVEKPFQRRSAERPAPHSSAEASESQAVV